MRWFVEVSRVGEVSSDEKFCVEAKQWQAALQEARKLRGDSGPLSKFSIELLDDGYRAVDPKQKLRYVIGKAPSDAQLTPSVGSVVPPAMPTNGLSVAAPFIAPSPARLPGFEVTVAPLLASSPSDAAPAAGVAPLPASAAEPVVPVPADALPPPLAAHAEPYAGVPSSALSPAAPAGAALAAFSEADALAHAAAVLPPATRKSPSAFPPRPGGFLLPASVKPPAGITVPSDAIPPAPPIPRDLAPIRENPAVWTQNLTQPSMAVDMPPPSSVLRKRQEEPSSDSPITYREVAYLVEAGVTRASVEALLWASFRDISRELSTRLGQKFVQLAVFDHTFEKRPERAPLGTLAWKDWRGNPVLTFPFFDGTAPARASGAPPSIIPVAVVSISAPPAAVGQVPAAVAPVPAAASMAPVPAAASVAPVPAAASVAPVPVVSPPAAAIPATTTPILPLIIPTAPSTAPAGSGVAGQSAAPAPAPLPPPSDPEAAAAIPLTREKSPAPQQSASRSSRPRLAAVRRRAGEDLIGELFETMHDLNFMSGVGDGAEFVLQALESIVPCEGVLIHVFDINKRQFVVVRAKGADATQTLLHRTPDTEAFFDFVMHRPGSIAFQEVERDPRVLGARWQALGVKPTCALCGPVRQGGRYLGLVEVANPLGGDPFHQTEQNAIDYVCEQFAQFLANRPIVLDPEVLLRR